MGTSSYFGGATGRSALLPPWADDIDGLPDDSAPLPDDSPNSENKPDSGQETDGENNSRPNDNEPRINNRPLRKAVRSYVSGGSGGGGGGSRRVAKSAVKTLGGAKGASSSSRAGRRSTAGIGRFAGDIARSGIRGALERLNLGDAIGRPVGEILSRVADALTVGEVSVEDREAARVATLKTLSLMYERYEQEGGDINALDAMRTEDVGEFVVASVGFYVYERIMQAAERVFEGEDYSHQSFL